MTSEWSRLVLYDGECGLCDRSVQWLLRRDHRHVLRFAPLQGDTARPFTGGATHFESMVLIERDARGEHIYQRSRAVLRMLGALGQPWRALSWLRLLPAFLTDLPYRLIARYRLSWFGKSDPACRVATAEERALFLP